MKKSHIEQEILAILMLTPKFVNSRTIINSLGIRGIIIDPVSLRKYIQFLRLQGHPIIASNKGYKYATLRKELQEYVDYRYAEIKLELKALRRMRVK